MIENEGVRVREARCCLLRGVDGVLLYSGLRDRLFGAPVLRPRVERLAFQAAGARAVQAWEGRRGAGDGDDAVVWSNRCTEIGNSQR
jgi:hypothetical protein